MGATVDALHTLQQIELELRSVRDRLESKRRAVRAQQRRLAQIEQQIADVHAQTRAAQTEADRIELDRRTHEEHIAKLREGLNRAKTNKEYAALLTQLNTDKADTMKLEDRVLAGLTRVDELKKQEADLRAQLDKEKAREAELEQSASDLEGKLSGQLQSLESRREEAAQAIPPDALRVFERACERHEGVGIAIIARTHPKRAEFTCSGCNMGVTLEMINALQTREDVQLCQTCGRILYLDASVGAGAR